MLGSLGVDEIALVNSPLFFHSIGALMVLTWSAVSLIVLRQFLFLYDWLFAIVSTVWSSRVVRLPSQKVYIILEGGNVQERCRGVSNITTWLLSSVLHFRRPIHVAKVMNFKHGSLFSMWTLNLFFIVNRVEVKCGVDSLSVTSFWIWQFSIETVPYYSFWSRAR